MRFMQCWCVVLLTPCVVSAAPTPAPPTGPPTPAPPTAPPTIAPTAVPTQVPEDGSRVHMMRYVRGTTAVLKGNEAISLTVPDLSLLEGNVLDNYAVSLDKVEFQPEGDFNSTMQISVSASQQDDVLYSTPFNLKAGETGTIRPDELYSQTVLSRDRPLSLRPDANVLSYYSMSFYVKFVPNSGVAPLETTALSQEAVTDYIHANNYDGYVHQLDMGTDTDYGSLSTFTDGDLDSHAAAGLINCTMDADISFRIQGSPSSSTNRVHDSAGTVYEVGVRQAFLTPTRCVRGSVIFVTCPDDADMLWHPIPTVSPPTPAPPTGPPTPAPPTAPPTIAPTAVPTQVPEDGSRVHMMRSVQNSVYIYGAIYIEVPDLSLLEGNLLDNYTVSVERIELQPEADFNSTVQILVSKYNLSAVLYEEPFNLKAGETGTIRLDELYSVAGLSRDYPVAVVYDSDEAVSVSYSMSLYVKFVPNSGVAPLETTALSLAAVTDYLDAKVQNFAHVYHLDLTDLDFRPYSDQVWLAVVINCTMDADVTFNPIAKDVLLHDSTGVAYDYRVAHTLSARCIRGSVILFYLVYATPVTWSLIPVTVAPPTVSPPTPAPPTAVPTPAPPTALPTAIPTSGPTDAPPTAVPTAVPTHAPPTATPTAIPTAAPTHAPPTATPTAAPTAIPTAIPTVVPPTALPTAAPTPAPPTAVPTPAPVVDATAVTQVIVASVRTAVAEGSLIDVAQAFLPDVVTGQVFSFGTLTLSRAAGDGDSAVFSVAVTGSDMKGNMERVLQEWVTLGPGETATLTPNSIVPMDGKTFTVVFTSASIAGNEFDCTMLLSTTFTPLPEVAVLDVARLRLNRDEFGFLPGLPMSGESYNYDLASGERLLDCGAVDSEVTFTVSPFNGSLRVLASNMTSFVFKHPGVVTVFTTTCLRGSAIWVSATADAVFAWSGPTHVPSTSVAPSTAPLSLVTPAPLVNGTVFLSAVVEGHIDFYVHSMVNTVSVDLMSPFRLTKGGLYETHTAHVLSFALTRGPAEGETADFVLMLHSQDSDAVLWSTEVTLGPNETYVGTPSTVYVDKMYFRASPASRQTERMNFNFNMRVQSVLVPLGVGDEVDEDVLPSLSVARALNATGKNLTRTGSHHTLDTDFSGTLLCEDDADVTVTATLGSVSAVGADLTLHVASNMEGAGVLVVPCEKGSAVVASCVAPCGLQWAAPAPPAPAVPDKGTGSDIPTYVWLLAGSGGLLVVVVAAVLCARRRRSGVAYDGYCEPKAEITEELADLGCYALS